MRKKEENQTVAMRRVLKTAIIIMVVVVLLLVAFKACFRMSRVPTTSMEPTIHAGSIVVCWTPPYNIGNPEPKRGDIIAFYDKATNRNLIKRVIAVGGDVVEFHNGLVYVNGENVADGFELNPSGVITVQGLSDSYEVPEGKCFVLGDNREHSNDSRFMENPFIDYSAIRGVMVFTFQDELGLFHTA